MDNEKFTTLISEIKNWGPSPFAPDADQPGPFTFYNEMMGMAGTMIYEGFGKAETVSILTTSFRWILYNKRKRGGDRCRSYWHHLDFGDWHWEDPDGFVIAGVETTPLELIGPKTNQDLPIITWQTHFVSPEGEKKLFEEVQLAMQHYFFHQENRLVRWDKPITLPIDEEPRTELAASWYLTRLELTSKQPGTVGLDALWLLHDDPFEANKTEVGHIDPESILHPDNAPRGRTSTGVSQVSSNTGRGRTAKKVKRTAKKAVQTYSKAKGAADTAQQVASVVKGGGSAVKGVVEDVKQAAEMARGAGPRFCGNCGAPLKTGILFCGNCGQKLVQKAVDKAKDELKGAVEDEIVENVEKALDDEDEPKGQVKPPAEGAGKAAGPKEAPKTEASASEKENQPTKGKCPNCNRRVQPKWTFCPDCGQELTVSCPQCGEAIERGWKFCPHCTAEITSEE